MQMIRDAAHTALQSEMMKALFKQEQSILDIEDQANGALAAQNKTMAERLSDECRAKAEREAEAAERAAFDKRRALRCA